MLGIMKWSTNIIYKSVDWKCFLFSQWEESCIETFHAKHRSKRPLPSCLLLQVPLLPRGPQPPITQHGQLTWDKTSQNPGKVRKEWMNQKPSLPASPGLKPKFSVAPRMCWSYVLFLALRFHICVSLRMSCFLSYSTSPLLWKRSQAESTCVDLYRLSTTFLDHPPYVCKWQPTPGFLPGKSHGQRSLVGYSHVVAKSWTRLSDFTFHFWSLGLGSDPAQNQTHRLQVDPSLSCSSASQLRLQRREREGRGSLHRFLVGTSPRVCKHLEKSLSPSTLSNLFPFYYEIRQLQAGTCHRHLPSASLRTDPRAAAAVDFQHPWKELRAEQEWGWGMGRRWAGRTGLQRVRHFQELTWWAQFVYFPIFRKALISFIATTSSCE